MSVGVVISLPSGKEATGNPSFALQLSKAVLLTPKYWQISLAPISVCFDIPRLLVLSMPQQDRAFSVRPTSRGRFCSEIQASRPVLAS